MEEILKFEEQVKIKINNLYNPCKGENKLFIFKRNEKYRWNEVP